MTDELRAECDEKGIKYHHKAGEKKLKELLEEAEGTNTPEEEEKPVEEPTVAPVEVVATLTGDYHTLCAGDSCKVYNGEEFVREYSLEVHGEGFKELSTMFVNKKNK